MFDEQDRQYFYNEFKNNGYEVGSYDDFKKDLNNKEDRDWYYNEAKNMGYDVGTQEDFDKMVLEPAPSTSGGGKQVDASVTTQSVGQKASTETKPQVAQPAKKQETTDKEPVLIAKVLSMIPTGVQTSNGTYQPSPAISQPVVKGEEKPVKEEASPSSSANAAPVTTPTGVVNNEGLMDAKLANYIENWKQRPDKQSTYFENMVADLLADGTANSNEEAVNMVMPALRRYANRSAMDVTNQVVSSLPDDTVQDAEQNIDAQWYSHGVQDKLNQEAYSMGISYDDYVAHYLKPAMVQSLVNKYGPNYRNIAEGIATRLYSHDEHVQDRLMNQDINDALSSVINKYVSPSVVDEYNKAQEAGSKAFTEGMEGSQFIPANLRLGTALGAQYEANEAKDPAKVLSGLQKKFGNLYRNPEFLNDMSNAAFKVMQRYGLNGGMTGDPKQFKPMINSVLKNELDQLEIKGMMPKGSAEYIMKTGLGNTIVGKITRKAMQTDYQNWLEDIANQQYQPGFWENVASGSLTFAGDAWSYWLPGAAGGKLTKSMVAKAEGKLAGDLMAKGMERRVAERAAKVLIGKSKAAALKSGAAHGAVTFGGQSAISKPIDEIYRTGQFDENGKIYNPSVGKVIANTLGEVAKQSAVGAIMQGGTIANMVGKGRGLATNILADIGGKVVDSGIMTGQQLLERMAHDPSFKPTGKDAAETFLESGANLLSIGFPGFVGKYARFKDAREFNKKFDFSDQDIAELKRFGYDGLRDAFEKMGIGEYAVVGENAQRLDGQLTQKYMDLMNDKSVPEVLKAKMMAVVEGKRPSSFSPVVDSIIVQPMDNGKVYLETLNKDGGVVDRKEYSSLDEAQKADKKLEYEKTLGLASVLEGEFHNEFTQEHLEGLYNKAAQKYNMGEKLTDEDKAAVYLHQNAGAIKEIMDKQQKGIILTDEEQKQVNAYRHYYDNALENSSVMREFVNTFEDSHGVARGTLRKALESKDKKYAPLVESYLKELYNSIELKREMKQTMDDLYNTSHGNEQKRIEGENPVSPVEGSAEASAGGQEPPVSEGPSPYQGNTDVSSGQGEGVSTANSDNSSADVITSDAFVMGQNAYKNGDSGALQAIDYNSDLATGRLQRAFADNEKMPDIVANAYNEGRDMEQFAAQRASSLTPAQKEAISKYVEAMDAKKGAINALQHADDGYGEALKQQLWPYQTEDGNIVPATLDSGKQVFLKKDNEYGGAFVVVPDEQGLPTIKQVPKASIIEKGTPVPLDQYIEKAVAQQKNARNKQFISQFDGSGLKPNDQVTVAMEEGDANINMTFAGYSEDGKIVLTDGKDYLPLSKEEFAAWRKNALDNTINEHLDAEDAQRAENEAIKAEADKKERFANGIVGLSEGQPDYSSKDTDPNVAAEYLQEQFGEDHGKLLNLVNGSRDDIKTQLANKKKAAAEYQNWLDTNADLDPEKAKKVEDELSLVNEQIADLDARFKNWNTIRNSVMTPDEVKAMKEERKAEIERAGIDKSSVLPDVDTGVRIPENSELKDKYPTQEAASSYITSERRRVYKMQEETQREIDGVDKILNQYMDGEMELYAEQLRDLNTTKAELTNRQNALTADAKALKGKDESLNILYIKERAEQNKKDLEALSPKDRRKELVAKALEKKDMKAIKEIYKDASTDVMDLTPQTLEEFVSERLFPHSLNAESLAQELGSFNFKRGIGSKYDTNKYNYLLANNGEGLTINELAKRVWEDLSSTMESGGGDGLQSMYTDQDIRNTILDMFKTYDSVQEMRNVTLLNRIAAAENELSGEEEWYEQQKEREIYERQAEIEKYKSYIHDKELSLPSESELDHINGLEFDRMMEIEDREREYKQYIKSILPELADYDDRSNEEGYGGGSSLGSDSSRRGVDEGNSQGEEVGNGEASSESEIGEGSDSGRKGRQETGSLERGEGSTVRGSHLPQEASFGERLKSAIAETETEPTEAQKKAGNYKKGHLSFGGYDYTVETPKGVTRSGKDEQGKPWSVTMHDTYGYILGKIGVDGDHIDMFINDAADLDTFDGNVYVVDQVNPETGEFDEHKVMYGYPSEEAATEAYLANYSKGWKGLGKVTSVPKATFDKWLESSDRKTKPFADYAMVQKEQAKFDRDVKEVEPSEMTEAQKVAYDAVSTMLKKAGIPVKVVSNEDMVKVAEAQDNSLFAKYKDLDRQLKAVAEPGVRFLRTYHGTGASFSEFDFDHMGEGEGSQAFGWGGYVTSSKKIGKNYATLMDNDPSRAYYRIQHSNGTRFAKKYPTLESFLHGDKQIAMNDKFTEQEKIDFYNEMKKLAEPYHNLYEVDIPDDNGSNYLDWDKPLSKKQQDAIREGLEHLGVDIKKLESKGQSLERTGENVYNSTLYIGLTGTEYDLPEITKGISTFLSSVGFTGIKYKAGRNFGGAKKGDTNYVIFKPEDMKIVDRTKFAQNKGVVYGYTDGKEIVLNQEHLNPNTPIHEYQHLWRTAAKNMNPELIEHGDKLIMQTQLFADLKQDPNYNHLTDEQICDEAFARLTGEDGAAILEQMAKDAIKENPLDTAKELSVINKLKEWLKKFWYWALDTFTKWKPEDIKKMALEDIRNLVLRDLANGVDPRNVKSRMTKEDAVSLRKQMADNAEQERILEHTEENWLKEFGKDSRVTTPIGSIKLGENQYKKAGRNDRIKRFGLLKPTLERPDVILEKSAPKEGAERQTKYLFIKSFKKADGNKILNYESITVKQGEEEVAISAHQIDPSKVLKELTESKVLWNRFRGDSNSLGENQGSALTPSANNPSGKDSVLNPHSDANIRNNIETTKENGGNLSVEDKIKAVSQQFGVDEADVAMYANAVKKGSTAEAARARANIKRHLLQENEDKISSLKELLKYTVPVNNALKENFGDLDAMIEERVKQVEAQRNAMEAARKRAEEEEAKRQKHLEELSVIPDDQLDKQYMDALAKGDDATAREMLDEAARRKGYDDTESAYQGVGAWAAPGNPGYESDKARRDDWESSGSDVNLEDMALGYTPQPDDYFSHPERYSQNTPHGLESVKAINTAIDAIKNGEKDVKVKVYRAVPTSVKEGKLRNGDWVTPSKKYAEIHGNNRLEGKYRIIEDEVPATQLWWDGNDANEFGFDDGKAYKYKNAKNNRKLNDLVTYDDKGDVIPPSKRFNSRKSDIRFMFGGEKGAAEADKAEEKTYRMDNLKVAEKMERGKKANVKPRLGSATIGLKAAKDKVVELFNKAKSGEFNGKPQSIGTLTQEGKKFLEDLSGLKMKDKIDFVLNPSDLKHMNKDHFGDNEKDPGRNIPLTEEDLRSMVDVIMNPEQVVYGIEKMDNRKAFFFLKQAEDGTLNLAEIYSDKKGNLTAKSYYKTKKGVDQRVMEIKNSLLPTPEASSGSPLSDGKGINFFSIEQEKTAETAENERKIADSVVNTANKLGGAEATVYSSLDEVPEEYRPEVEQGAKGWYDPETHTVHVYLPNCEDGNDAQRTVFHEKIGHEGMEVLLGGENEVRKFANFVYRSVGKDVRGKIIDFANKYDPDWKNPDRMNVGTQEYIAHLAEEGPKTAEDFSLWTKIKHYLIKVLKKLGVRVPGLLNDKDLRYYLMKAGKALHVWDNMPKEKQEAMMKQASNAEIKDALSDGAGKGKPRQKQGESMIQYMKRVQEWRKWKNAREDENDPEPPMFYDIDKDEEGKKEWAQLNKDWRERHHLAGEEPMGMPIRMEGEEDGAYMTRIHEYEKWKEAMKDQEDPMPDMFAFEKKKQEEVKRKYEDWLAKHDLLEQQQADLDLYEGKIYPAETNPKADALEQQVMQDLAEVTSTDVSKEGAAKTVKHAVIHRRKNMEEASADDAIYINDVKNRIEKMADSGAFDKLLSDYKGEPNRAEKLAEAIPYIIEAPRRLRDLAHDLNATGAFEKGHIHIQPTDVEAIQPFVADLIAETAKMHTVLKDDKEVKVYDDPQAVSEVANKLAQAINANHQGEEDFVPIDGTDILSKHVLPLVKQQIVPVGIEYKNLSPEMKAAIDSIRDWYNYTYDWLKDNHTLKEDAGYNVDYVNHIWDKEKSDEKAYAMYVENRQRTKSPNEKPRTISTLMEGISVGLVPKTTDITKMMAYYSRSNIEAWVNKTMLQELSGLNVIERNEDGEIVSSDPLLSSTPPFNLEQYKYFEIPGVGPVWVYNVSPKQMKVKNPITGKEKVLYSEASAGDRFGVVFETYQSSPFWKAFDTLASSAKKLELGFSGFHAGALTEVYMVQNMVEFGPKKAMANFMKYIFVDTMKNHQLPCFANPEDFQEAATHLVKFGATNDYAAADVQNMFDNMRDFAQKLQKKLEERGNIGTAAGAATIPFEIATQMVSMLNKGMDVALWDFLHDGLKLATYRMRADRTKERAKKYGWTDEQLSKALDEDGQFVNDMFGGQHWDIVGASQRTIRIAGRCLLSPDWNKSTTSHFLAITGFGSVWNEATFENFKEYYKHLWAAARGKGELTPEDWGRFSRQKSALLCYGIGFMVFYEGIANGINAAFRALDEEKERKKAEEIRKTNPSYKSMYELAYPDGMKWYDYLMRGNSLGQQSKIFLGRYEDGTEMYVRHGKQFREVPEYLFNHKGELEFPGPMVQRMIGKANPMVRMTLDDINYLSDFQASHADQEIQRKYGKTIGLLYKDALYWAPFLIPSQENKEFKAVDFFFPSSKGFSTWKAQSYFKDFILSGDMEGVVMTYQSCQRNGIDAEAQIKAAIGSVKALESAEMSDGVTSLQEASKRFDAAKSITEKKKMRQKIKKFLSQSNYKAFTQKEALDMVQGYLNGDEDLKEMEKAESKYLMKAKAEDVTEDWRIQNVWNGTMETYQEYQRLKDVDKAKANTFKNSKTNKRLFAARKAISAARRKMNKAKKQMDGTNDAAKLVEIRNTRKELLKTLNGME